MTTYECDTLQEIIDALAVVNPDDIIDIRDGSYQPIAKLEITRDGTDGHPIIFRGHAGETVIIEGSLMTGAGWQPPMIHVSGDYWEFSNFRVTNNVIGRGIYSNSDYLTFDHIESDHNYGSGFYHVNSHYNEFYYIEAHHNSDPDPPDEGGNADGISIESGAHNTIKYCLCYNNSDDGIDVWQSTYNTIENCVSHDNGLVLGNGNGFKLGNGGHNVCRFCISYQNKKPISAAGGRGFTTNGGAGTLIEYCTSFDNDEYEFLNTYGLSNTFKNNIAVGSPNSLTGATHSYNNWNLEITDPEWISEDPVNEYFLSLSEGSPCRGVSEDEIDIGALQYGETIDYLLGGGMGGGGEGGEPPMSIFDNTMSEIVLEISDREIYNDIRSQIDEPGTITETEEETTDEEYDIGVIYKQVQSIAIDSYLDVLIYVPEGYTNVSWINVSVDSDTTVQKGLSQSVCEALGGEWFDAYDPSFPAYSYTTCYLIGNFRADFLDKSSDHCTVKVYNTGSVVCPCTLRLSFWYLKRPSEVTTTTRETIVNRTLQVRAIDETSIAKYGRRVLPITWPLGQTEDQMQALVDAYLERHKEPIPILNMRIQGRTDALISEIFTKKISDKVTIVNDELGLIATDFFINKISAYHSWDGLLECDWTLEQVRDMEATTFFTLDISELDGAHILAW